MSLRPACPRKFRRCLANDTFTVAGTTGNVVVNGRATLAPTGIETLDYVLAGGV
jgi:hypothetical protein